MDRGSDRLDESHDDVFFDDAATTEIYTLSLHDALPISSSAIAWRCGQAAATAASTSSSNSTGLPASACASPRSEEHTSELQSRRDLVCRLLLEKKKINS